MILQSLVSCYDALDKKGKIPRENWSIAKVSYALVINENGELTGIVSLKQRTADGKKTVRVSIQVPEQIKKTSGVASNFMCENAAYFLGFDSKGKPERTKECFMAATDIHHKILDGLDCSNAKRILSFFDNWEPSKSLENKWIISIESDIEKGANFIFEDEEGNMLHKDSAIISAWEKYHSGSDGEEKAICLVTGEMLPVAVLHPNIKGIRGAKSSGATLVSFNASASESYGHDGDQGRNAPVSKIAAFKYTTALNYLISDNSNVTYLSDIALIYWAEGADKIYQSIFSVVINGNDNEISEEEIGSILDQVSTGGEFEINGVKGSYDNNFYILGIAPNAARLSVSFFLKNRFGEFTKNLIAHNSRLQIIQPMGEHKRLPLWNMLNETADQKSSSKTPPKPMTEAVLRSILMNTSYPYSLYESIIMRIRKEHDINWRKAAIIKAFLVKNYSEDYKLKEVLTMSVSESDYEPYVLGRLFAVLEMVQKSANPGIKATIKDKYFTSASSTPARIFPVLIELTQHHLRKLNDSTKTYYDKLITKLQGMIQAEYYPQRQNLKEQGAFYLGYYHEKQSLYTKSEEKGEE